MILYSSTAQAGLLSAIMKAGKKADIDTPALKYDVDLPGGKDDLVGAPYLDESGNWKVKLKDKSIIDPSAPYALQAVGKNKLRLLIDVDDLPSSLDKFLELPPHLEIYVVRKKQAYRLKKAEGWSVAKGRVEVAVGGVDALQQAVWHLQRPWSSGAVHIVGAGLKSRQGGSRVASIDIEQFLNDPARLKHQTLVVPGRVSGNELFVAGQKGQGVDLRRLKQHAQENSINLVVLDAVDQKAARMVGKQLLQRLDASMIYDDTAKFFQRFGGDEAMRLTFDPSRNSQTLISNNAYRPIVEPVAGAPVSAATVITDISLHGLLHAVHVIRPDQEHAREYDQRIVPMIHSNVQWYLLASLILGFMSFSFTRSVWQRIWPPRRREQFGNVIFYASYALWRGLLFALLFVPLLGLFTFIASVVLWVYRLLRRVVLAIWWMIETLLIKPPRYIYRKIAGSQEPE
ncbi:hypothetical protein [Solemya pervernicosa gill symbiont]|uniref:hypothetical protein n=1 Tax=Solemya pervernicosa gill symbiont TaxID=642797 RepID=UPI001561689D|nr:hypothetical protein [Solemya pervernicosa gill symbiont]